MRNPIYRKYAEAVYFLEQNIRDAGFDDGFNYVRAPIGLDGAVTEYLLEFDQDYRNFILNESVPVNYSLKSTLHASSKTGEVDREKLSRILHVASDCHAPALFIDIRTKTGSLGKLLKQEVDSWMQKNAKEVGFYYAVLFDPEENAHIRGSEKELYDEERLMWVDSKERVSQLIARKGDSYEYRISRKAVSDFNHIDSIKLELKELLDEECSRNDPK